MIYGKDAVILDISSCEKILELIELVHNAEPPVSSKERYDIAKEVGALDVLVSLENIIKRHHEYYSHSHDED